MNTDLNIIRIIEKEIGLTLARITGSVGGALPQLCRLALGEVAVGAVRHDPALGRVPVASSPRPSASTST